MPSHFSTAIILYALGSDLDIQTDNKDDTQAKGHLDWEGDFKGGKNYEGDSFNPLGLYTALIGLVLCQSQFSPPSHSPLQNMTIFVYFDHLRTKYDHLRLF